MEPYFIKVKFETISYKRIIFKRDSYIHHHIMWGLQCHTTFFGTLAQRIQTLNYTSIKDHESFWGPHVLTLGGIHLQLTLICNIIHANQIRSNRWLKTGTNGPHLLLGSSHPVFARSTVPSQNGGPTWDHFVSWVTWLFHVWDKRERDGGMVRGGKSRHGGKGYIQSSRDVPCEMIRWRRERW